MSDSSKPLAGNPARQAVHSLLGYDYQIWRSLEAWLSLEEGETLFLECAEDYDVVTSDGGTAVQVKKSPADISLGMQEIRGSIDDFWDIVTRNEGRGTVSLRYLTRGGVALEQGSPFGQRKGIELWGTAAAGDLDACARLAEFLGSKALSDSFLAFLKAASREQLHEKLFARVEWVVGEPSAEAIRLNVERFAVRRGAQEGISAVASVVAVDSLLARCREAATRAEPALRCLTREDLALHFGRATSVSVPLSGVALQALSRVVMAGVADTSGPGFALAPSMFDFDPPELPEALLPRESFASIIARCLENDGAVLIVGSEGRGKTTVANVVARASKMPSLWLDLAGLDDAEIVSKLRLALSLVRNRAPDEPLCVVLDDLPVAAGMSQALWSPLSALVKACRSGSRKLLATAKGVEADAVDHRVLTSGVATMSVPDLERDEIEVYFESLGCGGEFDAVRWAAFALNETGGGHPKLVYLLGLELHDQGWPAADNKSAAAAPRSLEQARAQARRVASSTVSDGDRQLLYALSAAAVAFDRSVAISVGAALNLDFPGEAFARLRGRWVESRGGDLFTVTSLLAGSADQVWHAGRLAETHGHLFDAFLSREYIRVDEAVGILSHAIRSRDALRTSNFLGKMTLEDVDTVPGLMEQLDPLLQIVDVNQIPAFGFDPKGSVLLRMLQFRVAKARQAGLMPSFAAAWRAEIESLPQGKMRDSSQLIHAFSVISAAEGAFPARVVVKALVDIVSLENIFSELPPELLLPGASADGEKTDLISSLFSGAQIRCDGWRYLRDFLSELDATPLPIRERILRDVALPSRHPSLNIFERAWLVEAKNNAPEWPDLLAQLRRGIELAEAWGAPSFAIRAAKVVAIIQDEELGEVGPALTSLRQAQERFGTSSILREHEANVLFRRGRHDEALSIWREVFADQERATLPGHDHYSCRKAAIVAAKANLFEEAAGWLERAADFVHADEPVAGPVRESYLIDAAHCWFRADRGGKAVELLARAIGSSPDEVKCGDERRAFMNLKCAGHATLWMLRCLVLSFHDAGKLEEPLVGQCSVATISEELAALPATTWEGAAALLLRLDVVLEAKNPSVARMRPRLEASNDLVVQTTYWTARLEESFGAESMDDIAIFVMRLQAQAWRCEAQRRVGWDLTQPFDVVVTQDDRRVALPLAQMLLAALMIVALRGRPTATLCDRWTAPAAASDTQEAAAVAAAVEEARAAFFLGLDAARRQFLSDKSSPVERLGAAASLLSGPILPASVTAICQMATLMWLAKAPGFESMVQALAPMFARMWIRHLETPALLVNPRVSAPALRSSIAIATSSPGMLVALFESVSLATGELFPASLREALEKVEGRVAARARAMPNSRPDEAERI